jgi:hypothetical protein
VIARSGTGLLKEDQTLSLFILQEKHKWKLTKDREVNDIHLQEYPS